MILGRFVAFFGYKVRLKSVTYIDWFSSMWILLCDENEVCLSNQFFFYLVGCPLIWTVVVYNNGRKIIKRFTRMFSMSGAFRYIKQSVILSAYILQKVPGRNRSYSQRATMSRMPYPCRVQSWWITTQCITHANFRRNEE